MEDLSIELTFRENDFKEIYYSKGKENIFVYAPTKKILFRLFCLLIFTAAIYFLSLKYSIFSWLLFLCFLSIILLAIQFYNYAPTYYSWKKEVDNYLKELSHKKNFKLIIKEHSFDYVAAEETIIEKWANISSSKIRNDYISMLSNSGERYLFPAKSMTKANYEKLIELIKENT